MPEETERREDDKELMLSVFADTDYGIALLFSQRTTGGARMGGILTTRNCYVESANALTPGDRGEGRERITDWQ